MIKRSDLLQVELGNRKENVPNKSLEPRTSRPSPGSSNGQTPGRLLGGRRPNLGVISSSAQNMISTGFQTARGGTVQVSKESLVKVERDFLKFVGGDTQRARYWQMFKAPRRAPQHPCYNKAMPILDVPQQKNLFYLFILRIIDDDYVLSQHIFHHLQNCHLKGFACILQVTSYIYLSLHN